MDGWHLEGRFIITEVSFRLPKSWQPLKRYADIAAELETHNICAPNARQIADAVIAVRRRKLPDPREIPNVGSFFHNPVVETKVAQELLAAHPSLPCYPQPDGRSKLAAGWLIEQAGWKGRNLGRAGMYENQALVLVNRGNASVSEVIALMHAVQNDVRQKFGVELTPEPIFL